MGYFVEVLLHLKHIKFHYLGCLLRLHFHNPSILYQQMLACQLEGAKEKNQREKVDNRTVHASTRLTIGHLIIALQ